MHMRLIEDIAPPSINQPLAVAFESGPVVEFGIRRSERKTKNNETGGVGC
jgi:hypothetical protein